MRLDWRLWGIWIHQKTWSWNSSPTSSFPTNKSEMRLNRCTTSKNRTPFKDIYCGLMTRHKRRWSSQIFLCFWQLCAVIIHRNRTSGAASWVLGDAFDLTRQCHYWKDCSVTTTSLHTVNLVLHEPLGSWHSKFNTALQINQNKYCKNKAVTETHSECFDPIQRPFTVIVSDRRLLYSKYFSCQWP